MTPIERAFREQGFPVEVDWRIGPVLTPEQRRAIDPLGLDDDIPDWPGREKNHGR